MIKIPEQWRTGVRYFFTYYGDVYQGRIVTLTDVDDRFFIISNNKIKEYKDLGSDELTISRLNKLGWEIKDPSIIIKSVRENEDNRVKNKSSSFTQSRSLDKYKKMIVFGAGASSFCAFGEDMQKLRDSELMPPLGNEVFHEKYDEYCTRYPGVNKSLSAYEAANKDIEAFIESEWKQIRNSKRLDLLSRHINVQHYIQELMSVISDRVISDFNRRNLYSLLAQKLMDYYHNRNDKLALVSFNYDTILDHYLEEHFSHSFSKMEDYVNYDKPFVYYKPHGSVNWGWRYNTAYSQLSRKTPLHKHLYGKELDFFEIYFKALGNFNTNISNNNWSSEMFINKDLKGRYTINKDRIQIIDEKYKYYPALLIPHKDKDEFVMPYFHQDSMRSISSNVEELYLIGWKGKEDVFNRFINKGLNNLKKIVIVSPDEKENGEIEKELQKYDKYRGTEIEVIHDFETFVLKEFDNYFKN